MKTSILILLAALLPILGQAQASFVNNGAVVKISAATNVKVVNGSITNKNNGQINNEGSLSLDLDYTQNTSATYTGGASSSLNFEGGANQSIQTDAAALDIARLKVDNGNRLMLNSPLNVSTTVDLSNNGSIELGTHNLILSPSATVVNFDASSYIVTNSTGVLEREVGVSSVVFPIGNSSYNPVTLSNAGTTDNFQVRIVDEVRDRGTIGPVLSDDVVTRTWFVEEATVGGSDVTMVLQWSTADEGATFDRAQSGVSRHSSGTLWDNPASYGAATNIGTDLWTQSRSGFSSFSPFVVRDQQATLPIELLSFEAQRINPTQVALNWSTATEINASHFEVERMLDNSEVFTKVGEVAATGNTTTFQAYAFQDANAHQGLSYYRLKQVDEDGSFEYSEIRAVAGKELGMQVAVFPNPVDEVLKLRLSYLNGQQQVDVRIVNSLGQVVFQGQRSFGQADVVEIREVADLVPGAYYLQLNWGAEQVALPFVKR